MCQGFDWIWNCLTAVLRSFRVKWNQQQPPTAEACSDLLDQIWETETFTCWISGILTDITWERWKSPTSIMSAVNLSVGCCQGADWATGVCFMFLPVSEKSRLDPVVLLAGRTWSFSQWAGYLSWVELTVPTFLWLSFFIHTNCSITITLAFTASSLFLHPNYSPYSIISLFFLTIFKSPSTFIALSSSPSTFSPYVQQ